MFMEIIRDFMGFKVFPEMSRVSRDFEQFKRISWIFKEF